MGSPYFVHTTSQNISVIRTEVGFLRTLPSILGTLGVWDCLDFSSVRTVELSLSLIDGPAYVVLVDLIQAFKTASQQSKRTVVFLGARYEFRGWEKFQRVIVFDMTKSTKRTPS